MERNEFNTLTKTQATKKKRRKFPNVFFKKELMSIFDSFEEPKFMIGAFITFFCALRISEVCKLKWNDVDLENNRLKVVDGKCHKDGYVPISSICLPVIKKWRAMNLSEEFFIPLRDNMRTINSVSMMHKQFKKAISRAGLRIITDKNMAGRDQHQYKFHTLRHSRCTHLLSNGVPVQKVQHFMRHDKIDTTMTYTWILDVELNSMVEDVDSRARAKISREVSLPITTEDPIDIARKRLAYGEISINEYRKLICAMEVLK